MRTRKVGTGGTVELPTGRERLEFGIHGAGKMRMMSRGIGGSDDTNLGPLVGNVGGTRKSVLGAQMLATMGSLPPRGVNITDAVGVGRLEDAIQATDENGKGRVADIALTSLQETGPEVHR